jgi:serine/threonine-protein kinase
MAEIGAVEKRSDAIALDATLTEARLEHDALGALARGTPSAGGDGAPGIAVGHMLAGRYRVVRFIAAGGMGEVYEVDDALLGERVAIKLLRPELSQKPGAQARFADEIKMARKVTHPNVCRVFDVGVDGGLFFFTMELHLGETLASRLCRSAPMDVATARPIVAQLLAGVAAAHAVDIVHTDLKPSNVLLTGKGNARVVLTDFGLALPCCAELGCGCSMPHLIGTPAYMSPEQVAGGTVLDSTDLFSIGVILFEMLTGELPYRGATALEMAHARLTGDPPSPRARRPEVDPAWDQVVRACLAREHKDRPRSVREVAAALGITA